MTYLTTFRGHSGKGEGEDMTVVKRKRIYVKEMEENSGARDRQNTIRVKRSMR